MSDPTLVVPGTQASRLYDQDDVLVYNAVRVSMGLDRESLGGLPPEQWVPLLSMESAPGQLAPVRTSLMDGKTLRSGASVVVPYQVMSNSFRLWNYDWRLDLRYNAQLLLDYLREQGAGPRRRWNLIGHSQGGLLIALAARMAGAGEFSRLVARAVTVGAPFAGSMKAAGALLWGSTSLGPGQEARALEMARTWPAIFQMNPSWGAVTDASGTPLPADRQLGQPGGWPASWKIDPDMLQRSRDVMALLQDPLGAFGPGVATLTLMGNALDTPVSTVRTGDAFDEATQPQAPGDTLVPADITTRFLGTIPPTAIVKRLAGNIRAHATLCEDETVLSLVRQFLDRKAPSPSA
jgi:pimeloyl-ACP methyl ester carboxylesterase